MTVNNGIYRIVGGNGSPYSVKLRAVMRYRHLPLIWQMRTPEVYEEVKHIKPLLQPILQYPEDGSYHFDTTPVIYELEKRHPGQRSVVPDDEVHAFLAFLIEDMADEWLTKPMFYYRWIDPVDQDYAARWIINDNMPDLTGDEKKAAEKAFRDRQVGRMALVGSTAENGPVIEESYHRFLTALEGRVGQTRHLFGSRPSIADFGIFGQFWPLGDDPTSCGIMREKAPHTFDWRRFMDDASGVNGEWQDADAPLSDAVNDLLAIVGDTYMPFLLGNKAAMESGAERMEVEIRGMPYAQGPFGYQVKCLKALRDAYAALSADAKTRVNPVLEENGILSVLG